jgi:tripartite-type tricarboxylate transporter receptor subunit TctC
VPALACSLNLARASLNFVSSFRNSSAFPAAVPGGTPAPIVQRLNAELVKILQMPDVRRNLSDQGADLQGGTPEDFGTFMRNESARWSVVVKQAGIKPE